MLSAAYALATWVEYLAAGLAVIALVAVAWRLRRPPRKPILGAVFAVVISGALFLGSHKFLGTRITQVRLDSIKQLGLELRHDGLRTDALRYNVTVSVPVTFKPLPSGFPASGVINGVSGYLVHSTTTVSAQVAVYGLIDFTAIHGTLATVDRQARTITLALPNPAVDMSTTYIAAVDGVQEREEPLTAIAHGVTGLVDSLIHRPVQAVNPAPELAKAEAVAVRRAQGSGALQSCGRAEIVRQLAGIFHLTPAYRGYAVRVRWPTPASAAANCGAMQTELTRGGS